MQKTKDIRCLKDTKYIKLYLLLCFMSLFSCTRPDRLEEALQMAGDNRAELEKALSHYSSNPADSLKLKAAKFLIENMPYYYSYKNDKLELYQKEVYSTAIKNKCKGDEAFKILEQKYGSLNPAEFEKVYDIQVITADYLIRNIEQSFKVWREKPWGKQISFDDFCEQILPYRIKNEPLSEWREAYYNHFQPVLDSLLKNQSNPVEAIRILWDTIHSQKWVYCDAKPQGYPSPPAIDLLSNNLSGDCYELANRGVYIMRALGIQGGYDYVLNSPYGIGKHAWNSVVDSSGKVMEFALLSVKPKNPKKEQPCRGCVYRLCFGLQPESLIVTANRKNDIPPLINNPFIKNVSEYYLPEDSICIAPNERNPKDKILYLFTFNRHEWSPAVWTKKRQNKFTFHHVENSLLYLPAYYVKGQIIPQSEPGYVNRKGIFTTIVLDTLSKQKMLIKRKYPAVKIWETHYNKRILNGKFQAANNPDFRNATTLYTITEISDMQWHSINTGNEEKYRYVRYLSGDSGWCNMAETIFLSDKGKKLHGKIIGRGEIIKQRKTHGPCSLFDGDPLTFFDAKECSGTWAGLELKKPAMVRTIQYLFRNDDNNIRSGDTYELFFWNKNRWVSLGRRLAGNGALEYDNAPGEALFWLHNHTRGREERPFIYRNGEQIFFSTDKIKNII